MKRRYYCWVIFAVALLCYFCSVGLQNNVYSLFLLPVSEALNTSRTAFSLATTIQYASNFFANLLFGTIYIRFGHRKCATVALFGLAAVYFCYSRAANLVPFYIGAVVAGIITPYFNAPANSRLITKWFHARRGLILGILMSSSGLGGSLFSIVQQGIIDATGWQSAYVFGAALLVVCAALAFLLIRGTPEEAGCVPFGEGAADESNPADNDEGGFSITYLKKQPVFWLMLVTIFFTAFYAYGLLTIIVAHIQDRGMTAAFASRAQAVMYLAMAGMKVAQGWLSDKIGAKKVMLASVACGAIGIALLAQASSPAVTLIALAFYSSALAIPSIVYPLLAAELYGQKSAAHVIGMMMAMNSLSGMAGTPLANLYYDTFHSYTGFMYISAVLGAGVIAMLIFVYGKVGKMKEA